MNVKGEEDHEEMMKMEELRRGPWTVEEDFSLINYISLHGEGRWNSLARAAGTFLRKLPGSYSILNHANAKYF